MRPSRNFAVLFFFLLFLPSCGPTPAASTITIASSAASPPATESSPSSKPTETQTLISSAESTPTETPISKTAAPTGLNPSGPYAVFTGGQGIWIANPDGSFPTRISDQGWSKGSQKLQDALSPRGDSIAIAAVGKTGLDLILIEIPGGQAKTVSRLLDITRNELALNSLTPKAFAYYAITEYPNLAWQPGNGDVLAYVSAEKGPTTDMYTYDRAWDKFRHLEENPSQAISPIWSPDGEYLLFFGINWLPPFGQTYVTFHPMEGFWAVRASDGGVISQPAPKGTYQNFVGWQDDSHYLVYDSDEKCAASNLRAVDLTTGGTTMIAEFCFHSRPAWSPGNKAILLSAGSDCDCGIGEGVFLILPGQPAPTRLMEEHALELFWLPESGVFYAYPEALFSADGETRYDPPVIGSSYHPAVSKNGYQAWEVIEDHRSRVTVKTCGGKWQNIMEGNPSLLAWDPMSGDTLLIVLENGELYSATAPDFIPEKMGNLGWTTDQATWIPAPR
jgi:hypothetical protein